MSKIINLIDKQYSRLKVIKRSERRSSTGAYWLCRCACGKTTEVISQSLQLGSTKSCGCLRKEIHTKHGKVKTKAYQSWRDALQRCYNPNDTSYKNHGKRGIKVCVRWRGNFGNFYQDMGERPSGLTLDRIDNNANYSCGKCPECFVNGWPSNCRWATISEQNNNKRRIEDLQTEINYLRNYIARLENKTFGYG